MSPSLVAFRAGILPQSQRNSKPLHGALHAELLRLHVLLELGMSSPDELELPRLNKGLQEHDWVHAGDHRAISHHHEGALKEALRDIITPGGCTSPVPSRCQENALGRLVIRASVFSSVFASIS